MNSARKSHDLVWVSRPAPDGPLLADLLTGKGYDCLFSPAMVINPIPPDAATRPLLQQLAAAEPGLIPVFTSANGARMLAAQAPGSRGAPVIAIGKVTAAVAASLGYQPIITGAGDITQLASAIRARWQQDSLASLQPTTPHNPAPHNPTPPALVHICGQDRAGDLGAALADLPLTFHLLPLYQAEAAHSLPAASKDRLRAAARILLPLYSPRTARLCATLLQAAAMDDLADRIHILAFSQAVAAALPALPWAAIQLCADQQPDSIVKLLLLHYPPSAQ